MNKKDIAGLVENKKYAEAKTALLDELNKSENDIEMLKLLGLCNINLGNFDDALIQYEKVVQSNPDDAVSLYYLATIYITKANYPKAEQLLLSLLKIRENYFDAYKCLAVVYLKQKKYNDILNIEQIVKNLKIEDAELYDVLSAAAIESYRFETAVEYLQKAMSFSENKEEYLVKIGTVYFSFGNLSQAKVQFEKVLEYNSNNHFAIYNLGLLEIAKENYATAYEYLKNAYSINSRNDYLCAFALTALKCNYSSEAVKLYEKVVKIYPEKENYQYNLACAYEINNQLNEAIQIVEKLVVFNLNSVQLKTHLASLYLKAGKMEAAKALYEDLIESGISNVNILYEYAVICAQTKDTDKAEEVFKRIIEINPEYTLAYKDLAIIYLSRKFFDKTLEYFKKAYKTDPDNIYVLFEFGNYYHLMSDFENAKKMYNKILKNESVPVYMLTCIAKNYIAINQIKKAKDILIKAISLEPKDVEIQYNLAQVFYIEKNYEGAKQLLEEAYSSSPNTEIANLTAKVCMELGEYNQAYGLFNIVNLIIPNNISILMSMAECKYRQNELDTAKHHIEQIFKILPEYEDASELLKKIELKEKENK